MEIDPDDFCGGSPFWNESLLLFSSYPRFTDCFINTVLVWAPCGLLWLLTCPYLLILWHFRSTVSITFGKLNVTKTILSLALMGISIAELVHHLSESDNYFPAVYVADGVKIATFVLCVVIIQFERVCGYINSVILFPFWFIMAVASIIPLYTNIEEGVNNSDETEFYIGIAYCIVLILEFLTFFFADKQPVHARYREVTETKKNPETTSSIPSRLVFMWVNKLIMKGYRKKLGEDDYDVLPPADASDKLVPLFEDAWKKEVERCNELNKDISPPEPTRPPFLMQGSLGPDFKPPDEKTRLVGPGGKGGFPGGGPPGGMGGFGGGPPGGGMGGFGGGPPGGGMGGFPGGGPDGKGKFPGGGPPPGGMGGFGGGPPGGGGMGGFGGGMGGMGGMGGGPPGGGMGGGPPGGGMGGFGGGMGGMGGMGGGPPGGGMGGGPPGGGMGGGPPGGGMGGGPPGGGAMGKGGFPGGFGKDTFKRSKDDPFKHPSLLRVIISNYGKQLLFLQIVGAGLDLLKFVTPKITEGLLSFITERGSGQPEWRGYLLACSYFIVNALSSLFVNAVKFRNQRIGMHMRSTATSAIYKKSLTISNDAKKESTAGEIVNLMSVDAQRLSSAMEFMNVLISAPCQIIVALYMLFDQLGIAILAGLGVFCLMFPFNSLVSILLRKYNRKQMFIKDKRMRYMTEILNGMKVLKLYAWESAFSKIVQKIRAKEMIIIFKQSLVMANLSLIFRVIPYFVQLASFGVFIAIDDYLDPTKAFVSITLFNNLNMALTQMPFIIPVLVQALVALHRIENFLSQPDIADDVIEKDPTAEDAITIENGTFTWDRAMPLPSLRNINIRIKPGSLVAVVGTVGAGKTSLISAMLGEMTKIRGKVTIKSNVAYIPQEAWIQNATLKDNILFGSRCKSSFYQKVIEACALKTDLEILPGGDQTEIGEKGINISGGQKQRVSLARAVYNQADIYLLDDPLSAVDSHVGKHIFNNVIGHKGVLRDKTRVLVTHGIHWLPLVDTILVVSNGTITEMGTYEELLSHEGDFAQVITENLLREEEEAEAGENGTDTELDPELQEMKNKVLEKLEILESASSHDESPGVLRSLSNRRRSSGRALRSGSFSVSATHDKKSMEVKVGQKLVEDETVERGNVGMSVYMDYVHAIGLRTIIICICVFACYSVTSTYSRIWLSEWTGDSYLANISLKDTDEYSDKNDLYLTVYGVLGVSQGLLLFLFSVLFLIRTAIASRTMHNNMLDNVMKAPMSFFDTTPIGRIVNRFSRDVESLDNVMPNAFMNSITSFGNVIIAVVTITYSTPMIIAVVIPILIIYTFVQRLYMPASRQTKRIESATRSPIYIHFQETLRGSDSIRAYQAQNRNIELSKQKVDHNFKFYLAQIAVQGWLQIRLEFLGNFVVLAAAMFSVIDEGLSASLAGNSVTYASQVTMSMNFLIQVLTRLETEIVAVERMVEYTNVPSEKAWHNPLNKPSPYWPEEGNIQLEDFELRYRPGLDLVLHGVNCDVKGGQKIGIVGRTGAGKSSLTVALFRLVEAAGGRIVIDDKDIGELGLHDLRSKITILPQDPVIFSGTIRTNLDPSEEHDDHEIWEALRHAHLWDFVRGLPDQLDFECGENGQNLSVGQRQLVCLARTLLRRTKILVLDEATAAVDVETDKLIQNTIRTEFKSSTVITIAHRLNTILDYDKVIVMDAGNIKEMDSPSNLLANANSAFYAMAKDAQIVQ